MRRWTVVRTIGSAIVVVAVIAALYQLPASPFSRHGYPDRRAAETGSAGVASPSGASRQTPGGPVDPSSSAPAVKPQPVITYPMAGSRSYSVLPGNAAVIG